MFYYYDRAYDCVVICKSRKTRDAYVSLFPDTCEPIPYRTARRGLEGEMLSYIGMGYDEIDVHTLHMRELCDEVQRLRALMGGE